MWLTRVAINRRVTISMVILALVVMGLVGLSKMPQDLNPKVDLPIISITIPYPGAGPQEIEQRILRPVEDAVSVVNGVDTVSSVGYESMGSVTVQFQYGTDIDAAAADVRDALDRAKASFPTDVKQPSLYKIDIGALPIFVAGVTGKRSPRDLRKMVEDDISPRLGQIPGVASVSVAGGEVREVQVLAHRDRLEAAGLSVARLAQLLAAENLDVPSGSVKEGDRDYAVRMLGQFESIEQIRRLQISTPRGGLLPVSALAEVRDTVAEPTRLARLDGESAVTISIIKQSDANTVRVAAEVRRVLTELVGSIEEGQESARGELPEDIKVVVARDDSERVTEAIKDVRDALLWGALLAAIVVFLFLHNFRGTIIVAIAIPTSMMATFLPLGMGFGFTLNTMVMLGLSLAVGILVDDSIVVLENIERHLRKGEQPKAAAYNGRTEVGGAAVAITLVDVVVFIPIAMMGGIVGRFFYPFGITSFVCTGFSLLMSFTLTPMLASWWFTRHDEIEARRQGLAQRFFGLWDAGYGRLERLYRRLLNRAVRHPYITVAIGYMALILTLVGIAPKLPFEFFPASDAGQVSISVETAVGTRLEETDRIIRLIERRLTDKAKYPEVKHVTAQVGSQSSGLVGAGSSGGQYGTVSVTMYRRRQRLEAKQRSDQEFARALRTDLADIPDVTLKVSTESGMGGGGGGDVQLNVLCEDQNTLSQASFELAQKIKQIPGLLYVDLSSKPGRPEIHAEVDRLRAADMGVSAATVGSALRTAISGNTDAKYREGGDEYDLRVQLDKFDRTRVDQVGSLFLGLGPAPSGGSAAQGQPIRVRDVARVFLSTGPSQVERYNRQRKVTISATLDRAMIASGTAQNEIEKIVAGYQVPGVSTAWQGNIKMQRESFRFLFQALLLAVLLVYLVTAGLYNSLLQPLNVMFTIPMALVGGLLGLYLTHNSLSLVAMIGVIQLVGLVGKNAILVVDYTNTLRGRGLQRTQALLEAGPTRMKPVLMTTMAAIGGALPTALAVNEGSEWRAPMAVVVIFGLAVSTLLSLIVVPCTYAIWDQVQVFFGRIGRGLIPLLGVLGRRNNRRDGNDNPPEPGPSGTDGPGELPPPASVQPPGTEPAGTGGEGE
jgi:HAE1 family hydrophobic/amphiphilic exporter-1